MKYILEPDDNLSARDPLENQIKNTITDRQASISQRLALDSPLPGNT